MRNEVERTIIRAYPNQRLESPLSSPDAKWDYDEDFKELRALIAALKGIDPELTPSTAARYDVSEELVLFSAHRLQLSYLGPFATLERSDAPDETERELLGRVETVLKSHGITILSSDELEEDATWIQHPTSDGTAATVGACLFRPPAEKKGAR